jgi:hypothetical protein
VSRYSREETLVANARNIALSVRVKREAGIATHAEEIDLLVSCVNQLSAVVEIHLQSKVTLDEKLDEIQHRINELARRI